MNTPLVDDAFVDMVQPVLPTWIFGVERLPNQTRLIRNAVALTQHHPEYVPLAAGSLIWTWQHRPLDKNLLLLLIAADKKFDLLELPVRAMIRTLDKLILPPEDPDEALASLPGEPKTLLETLVKRINDPKQGLFWLQEGFEKLMDAGLLYEASELLNHLDDQQSLGPIITRFRADWAVHALTPEEAMPYVQAVDRELFRWWRQLREARLLQLAGEDDSALLSYTDLWTQIPWHTNLLLCLHDLYMPPVPPHARLPESADRTSILLYSWNKANDMGLTLESLAQSQLGKARIIALNNGSSDGTLQVIQKAAAYWPQRVPGSSFSVIDLPVNIGAPAARNWLLAQPEVRESEFVAFLDDDVRLPQDWLTRLLHVADTYPDAGAVGCRIVGHKQPHLLQAADFHPLPPEICRGGFTDFEEKIFIFDNCIGTRDMGLFAYTRPCASVTGCCHLIRQAAIREAGPFDIRFNPSQFDDLERDLRAYLKGFPCVYHGQLRVEHVQHSSLVQANSRAKQGHIFGNKLKLEHCFLPQEINRIVSRNLALLRNDLKRKLPLLHTTLAGLQRTS